MLIGRKHVQVYSPCTRRGTFCAYSSCTPIAQHLPSNKSGQRHTAPAILVSCVDYTLHHSPGDLPRYPWRISSCRRAPQETARYRLYTVRTFFSSYTSKTVAVSRSSSVLRPGHWVPHTDTEFVRSPASPFARSFVSVSVSAPLCPPRLVPRADRFLGATCVEQGGAPGGPESNILSPLHGGI